MLTYLLWLYKLEKISKMITGLKKSLNSEK
jgi:hypothetical protein